MWGLSSRGARLGDGRRTGRVYDSGLVRVTVRGPMEHAVVDIEGELDFTSAAGVVTAVAALEHRIMAVDVGALEFVDLAGVRALRAIRREAEARWGIEPQLTGVGNDVQRVIDVVDEKVPALTH